MVTKVYSILIWGRLLRLPVLNIFLAPFLSFFSSLLFSLPFTFHVLSVCGKKVGYYFILGEPRNGILINYRCNGLYHHHFLQQN